MGFAQYDGPIWNPQKGDFSLRFQHEYVLSHPRLFPLPRVFMLG